MKTLLNYMLIVEPDRQRLTRFVIEAVKELKGNPFRVAGCLGDVLRQLRLASADSDPLEVRFVLDGFLLSLQWNDQTVPLVTLPEIPADEQVDELTRNLGELSELADTGLLKQRNVQIRIDLEQAKRRAETEMDELVKMTSEMEALLKTKKAELKAAMRQAETDSLTGLYNRGAYDYRLEEAISRCQQNFEPMNLILMDLDHFKDVNDTHGHQYGDAYLQRIAKAIRDSCRDKSDHPCRIGGDEFALIIFANTDISERVARNILKKMDNKVSIGMAQVTESDNVKTLVARADAALYHAKESGRGAIHIDKEGEQIVKSA
jgi:two-component system cell cycle response regulator